MERLYRIGKLSRYIWRKREEEKEEVEDKHGKEEEKEEGKTRLGYTEVVVLTAVKVRLQAEVDACPDGHESL